MIRVWHGETRMTFQIRHFHSKSVGYSLRKLQPNRTNPGCTERALPYDTLTRYDTVTESLTVEKTLWDFSLVYSFWNKFIHFRGNPLLYILRQLIYTQYTVSLFIQYINSVLWTIIIWMVDWNRILTRRLPNSLIPVT